MCVTTCQSIPPPIIRSPGSDVSLPCSRFTAAHRDSGMQVVTQTLASKQCQFSCQKWSPIVYINAYNQTCPHTHTPAEKKWETCQVGSSWFNGHSTNLSQIGSSPFHRCTWALMHWPTSNKRLITHCLCHRDNACRSFTFADINLQTLKGPQFKLEISPPKMYFTHPNLNIRSKQNPASDWIVTFERMKFAEHITA